MKTSSIYTFWNRVRVWNHIRRNRINIRRTYLPEYLRTVEAIRIGTILEPVKRRDLPEERITNIVSDLNVYTDNRRDESVSYTAMYYMDKGDLLSGHYNLVSRGALYLTPKGQRYFTEKQLKRLWEMYKKKDLDITLI